MSIDINTTTAPEQPQQSLSTAAARNLATTTKTVPQMQGITSRWLLRMLPWVQVSGGTYRVNRRLTYAVGGGLVSFAQTGSNVSVIPPSLREVPALANVGDDALLASLAARFIRQDVPAGSTVVQRGHAADQFYLVVHGKLNRHGAGAFDGGTVLGVLADGSYFGADVLTAADATWGYTAVATTACTLLRLPGQEFEAALSQSHALRTHLRAFTAATQRQQNRHGEADIAVTAGHAGEISLPATFADYEQAPREYELSAAQTVLRVHSRVADLFNEPMNQVEQQLRLTIEALRERQEHEMINNPEFGLLHNVAYDQRVHAHAGPPTPDDLDELLSRRRSTRAAARASARDRGLRARVQQAGHLPRPRRGAGEPAARVAGRADLPVQQDPDHRRADLDDPGHADRGRGPGRGRPAPDRHSRRIPAEPERALHGRRRQGGHLVPGQRLLLGGRAGARRARSPDARRDIAAVQLMAPAQGQPFELPDFYLPHPPRLNPNVQRAREHVRDLGPGYGLRRRGAGAPHLDRR